MFRSCDDHRQLQVKLHRIYRLESVKITLINGAKNDIKGKELNLHHRKKSLKKLNKVSTAFVV